PRDKICAGWVTPAVVDELQLDVAAYRADGLVCQPITGFLTGMIGGKVVRTAYDEIVSYGIRRFELDAYLLERSGAPQTDPAQLKSLERQGDRWIANGTIAARLVIGAGGHFCPVARHIGAQLGQGESVVAAQEVEFKMTEAQARDCKADAETPELYFCTDLKGYGWVFRKGGYLNVGLGREDNHKLSEHVGEFVRWLKSQGRVPQDMPEKLGGHAYLLYNHAPRPFLGDHVMLIGDAAGLAYPQSGEGIRPAVESALFAAETIVAAKGDYSPAKLEPYTQKMLARFGARQSKSFTDHLPEGLKRFIGAKLMGSGWFARNVVMDEWFLHSKTPALTAAA
ncbi:MAG: NAD(P)/FAD-dependent oxidoreductase, partial [Burkholderiales bacterium]|nr:NAD(P)/FAD-dependent oxidoreductase [Burkholderiales bacterium]